MRGSGLELDAPSGPLAGRFDDEPDDATFQAAGARSRSRRLGWIAAGVALLGLGAGAAALALKRREEPRPAATVALDAAPAVGRPDAGPVDAPAARRDGGSASATTGRSDAGPKAPVTRPPATDPAGPKPPVVTPPAPKDPPVSKPGGTTAPKPPTKPPVKPPAKPPTKPPAKPPATSTDKPPKERAGDKDPGGEDPGGLRFRIRVVTEPRGGKLVTGKGTRKDGSSFEGEPGSTLVVRCTKEGHVPGAISLTFDGATEKATCRMQPLP